MALKGVEEGAIGVEQAVKLVSVLLAEEPSVRNTLNRDKISFVGVGTSEVPVSVVAEVSKKVPLPAVRQDARLRRNTCTRKKRVPLENSEAISALATVRRKSHKKRKGIVLDDDEEGDDEDAPRSEKKSTGSWESPQQVVEVMKGMQKKDSRVFVSENDII